MYSSSVVYVEPLSNCLLVFPLLCTGMLDQYTWKIYATSPNIVLNKYTCRLLVVLLLDYKITTVTSHFHVDITLEARLLV
jgi:hypothetical protein